MKRGMLRVASQQRSIPVRSNNQIFNDDNL